MSIFVLADTGASFIGNLAVLEGGGTPSRIGCKDFGGRRLYQKAMAIHRQYVAAVPHPPGQSLHDGINTARLRWVSSLSLSCYQILGSVARNE